MATGGEVQGQCPGSGGSEDLDQLKCQPCLEDGNLHEAVGMCIDCQYYLCSLCFKFHMTLPEPMRNHQLLDKQQMLLSQIRMSPKDICTEKCSVHEDNSLKNSDTFGLLSSSGKGAKVNICKDTIRSAKHDHDIHVKTWTEYVRCMISGLVLLPDGRLVLADCSTNQKIKTVNVQSGQILNKLKMSSTPWDVTAINNTNVAVTLPNEKKIAIVSVGDNSLSIDRYLTVSAECHGVDYRNDKLAVSSSRPNKVQVLNLQGTLIYTIPAEKQGKYIFDNPLYVSFGQDDSTLYVSNGGRNNVMCVKLDGTVLATYTDSDLRGSLAPVADSHGNVYVCAYYSNQVHQISKDCKKIQVLLTQDDGLSKPISICLSEEEDKLLEWKIKTTSRCTN